MALLIWSISEVVDLIQRFVSPSLVLLPWDIVPLLVAIGFWIVGVTVWWRDQKFAIAILFFLCSSVLAVGLLSGIGNDIAGRLFYILLAWLAPILFHSHVFWQPFPPKRSLLIITIGLYSSAFLFSLPFVFNSITILIDRGWFYFLRFGVRFSVTLSLLGVIVFLAYRVRNSTNQKGDFRLRLAFSSIVLSCTPLLLLSLIPSLVNVEYFPYSMNFIWLLFLPLSYGYSLRDQINYRIEKTLNTIIVCYLTAVLLVGGCLVTVEIVNLLMPSWTDFWVWSVVGLGITVLFLVNNAYQLIPQFAKWILYGNEMSRLELLAQKAYTLSPILDRKSLTRILVEDLADTFPLKGVAFYLKTGGCNFVLQGKIGPYAEELPDNIRMQTDSDLSLCLNDRAPLVNHDEVRNAMNKAALPQDQLVFLSSHEIGLWIPLVSAKEIHGFILLFCKPGDIIVNSDDRHVWSVFASQAGIASHNLLLTEDLQASRDELALAHHQLLHASEKERHQIACDLHDNAIQQLLGVSYHVADLYHKINLLRNEEDVVRIQNDPAWEITRKETLNVISQLRQIVGDLRPTGLEKLGLGLVIKDFVSKIQRQLGSDCPHIKVDLKKDIDGIPDLIKICLFRVTQEALRNILKHAKARKVWVQLSRCEDEIILNIQDDGCGFSIPERLSEFTQKDHYGLVGISERIAWVKGALEVHSQLNKGTRISVRIPLKEYMLDTEEKK